MRAIDSYRGISPGKIIKRYLSKNMITQREFADRIGIHFQNLNSILQGERAIPLSLSVAIDRELGFERGTIAVLQVYYELNSLGDCMPQVKAHPIIRDSLFWDVDPQSLDWGKHKAFIIKRVSERGNIEEKERIKEYYGLS